MRVNVLDPSKPYSTDSCLLCVLAASLIVDYLRMSSLSFQQDTLG